MYKLVDGKVRFEYDESKSFCNVDDVEHKKGIFNIDTTLYGPTGSTGLIYDDHILVCSNCAHLIKYFTYNYELDSIPQLVESNVNCPKCGMNNIISASKSKDALPVVYGEKCDCMYCKTIDPLILKGKCPSCKTKNVTSKKSNVILCGCGIEYQVKLFEETPFMVQHCSTCNKQHYNKLGNVILCSCKTEYQMAQDELDGSLYYTRVVYPKSNLNLDIDVKDVGPMILDSDNSYIGATYTKDLHSQKIFKVVDYYCKCGHYLIGKIGQWKLCVCGIEYKITSDGWISSKELNLEYICLCGEILTSNIVNTVECKCSKVYKVSAYGNWSELETEVKEYLTVCGKCGNSMSGNLGEIIKCKCGYVHMVTEYWNKKDISAKMHEGICVMCGTAVSGNLGDSVICKECGQSYIVAKDWKQKGADKIYSGVCVICGDTLFGKLGSSVVCKCGHSYCVTKYWNKEKADKIYNIYCNKCGLVVSGVLGSLAYCYCGAVHKIDVLGL